jgi:hypothetical protein
MIYTESDEKQSILSYDLRKLLTQVSREFKLFSLPMIVQYLNVILV